MSRTNARDGGIGLSTTLHRRTIRACDRRFVGGITISNAFLSIREGMDPLAIGYVDTQRRCLSDAFVVEHGCIESTLDAMLFVVVGLTVAG